MNITQYMVSISNTFDIEDLRVGIFQRLQLHICPVPRRASVDVQRFVVCKTGDKNILSVGNGGGPTSI